MKALALSLLLLCASAAADFRLGIIGTDTSHVSLLAAAFNDPSSREHVPGFRVVAAYKGGSPDVESSYTRVDKFAAELESKWNVEIVSDISALCRKVDGILLESVDGRRHLEQARQVIAAGKPMFIDKPMASTLEDVREISRLAKAAGVPWFSSSDERYNGMVTSMKSPDISGAIVWGPGPLEEHHYLDLSWYAIHEVEMLFALMGTGVEEVARIYTPNADELVGRWKDGRIGSVRALRPYGGVGAIVFRPKQVLQSNPKMAGGFAPLAREIGKFFTTGVPPFPNEETLEIFAFMDAAQRSKAASGRPMSLR